MAVYLCLDKNVSKLKRAGLVYDAEMCLIAALERAVPAGGEIFGLETKIPRKPRNQDEPQVGAVASW